MKIVCIKMTNGDEIVAESDGDDQDVMMLKRVRQLVVGQQGAGLIPWMMSCPDAILPVERKNTYVVVDAPFEVASAYTQTVTGLAMPGNHGKIIN